MRNKKAEQENGEHCNGNNSQWPEVSSLAESGSEAGQAELSDQEKLVLAQNEKES